MCMLSRSIRWTPDIGSSDSGPAHLARWSFLYTFGRECSAEGYDRVGSGEYASSPDRAGRNAGSSGPRGYEREGESESARRGSLDATEDEATEEASERREDAVEDSMARVRGVYG